MTSRWSHDGATSASDVAGTHHEQVHIYLATHAVVLVARHWDATRGCRLMASQGITSTTTHVFAHALNSLG